MIRINLLPHREERRAARQREFGIIAAGVGVAALFLIFVVHSFDSARIETQKRRNKFLQDQITVLDRQIVEIKKLKEQTQALLARKQVVETLQANRAATVHLLDQLVRLMPDGVYLKAIKQNGNVVNLQGYAQSNARVATLMRALDASPWLEAPDLVETKAATVNNLPVSEFSLNIKLTMPEAPAADAKKGKRA